MESGVDKLVSDLKYYGVIDADEQDLGCILVESFQPLEAGTALINHHIYSKKRQIK